MAQAEIKSVDFERFKKAIAASQGAIRAWMLDGTRLVSEGVVRNAEVNLALRAGGGKYLRAAADIRLVEGSDTFSAAMATPWLGIEFGGWVTNVFGHAIGTERQAEIGLAPMWAPWHNSTEKGYIMGSAWAELSKSGDASKAIGSIVLDGYREEFSKAGVKHG